MAASWMNRGYTMAQASRPGPGSLIPDRVVHAKARANYLEIPPKYTEQALFYRVNGVSSRALTLTIAAP
jgi:hypothetical protein